MTMSQDLRVLAVLRSPEAVPDFNKACDTLNGHMIDVQVGRLSDVRPGGAISVSSDVLVLDVDPKDGAEIELLNNIVNRDFAEIPVVATVSDVELHDIRQLMRLGVVDVLPQPVQQADLLSALDHAAQQQLRRAAPAAKDDSKVITFLKGGGGVGATTLAVQAGAILAGRYKSEKPKVCLMDLDVQFGTAALYLDLADEVGLADLLETPERVDSDMFHSVLSSHANKLDVLPAPREVMPLEAIEPEAVSKIVKLARKDYRFILLDLPEVWTPWSYRLLQESDQILLVTQFTVSGVRQARRQLDTLKSQGLEEVPLKVVLNRFDKGWGKSGMIKEAEQGLGRPIDYFIANDYKTVSEAINQGACLHEIKSRTKVEKGIRKMIESAAAVSADGDARAEPRLTL